MLKVFHFVGEERTFRFYVFLNVLENVLTRAFVDWSIAIASDLLYLFFLIKRLVKHFLEFALGIHEIIPLFGRVFLSLDVVTAFAHEEDSVAEFFENTSVNLVQDLIDVVKAYELNKEVNLWYVL